MPYRYNSGRRRSQGGRPKRRRTGSAGPVRSYRRTTLARGRNRFAYRNMRTGGLLGLEKKYFDQSDTATVPTGVSGMTAHDISEQLASKCLNAPATGDGAQNREGRKIYCINFQVNGTLFIVPRQDQGYAKFTGGSVFLAVVLDKQNNASSYVEGGQVWDNPVDDSVTAVVPFRNMSNSSRFVVLKKKLINLKNINATTYYDNTGSAASQSMNIQGFTIPFQLFVKGGFTTSFTTTGTTADSQNIVDNCVRFFAYVTTSDFDVEIAYNTRMRFYG